MNINAALGMVERPLQVGDWVEAIDPHSKWPMAIDMNKPMRVVDIVRRFGWDCLVLEGQKENPWVPYKFRRVDPPIERDEVCDSVERKLYDAILLSHDDMQQERDTLREQLATAQAEAELTDWRDTAEALYKAVPVAYERGQLPENGKRKPSEMVKEYLAELQAESAAMRDALDKARIELLWLIQQTKSRQGGSVDMAHHGAIEALKGTAGCDLLDRYNAEIDELGKRLASISEMHHDLDRENARLERKCRAAKAALVETYRGKIDGAWFGDEYPTYTTDGIQFVWRKNADGTIDARDIDGNKWWRVIGLTESGFPRCHADGTPLAKGPSREYMQQMADAEDECESVTAISPELMEALDGNRPPAKCESCGVAWRDHLGPTGLCKQLQDVVRFLKNQWGLVQDGDKWGVLGEGGNAVYASIVDAMDAAVQLNVEQLKKYETDAAMLRKLRELLRKYRDAAGISCTYMVHIDATTKEGAKEICDTLIAILDGGGSDD